MPRLVGVRVDGEQHPGLDGLAHVRVAQIEPIGHGVDFEHGARAHRGSDHGVDVEVDRLPVPEGTISRDFR